MISNNLALMIFSLAESFEHQKVSFWITNLRGFFTHLKTCHTRSAGAPFEKWLYNWSYVTIGRLRGLSCPEFLLLCIFWTDGRVAPWLFGVALGVELALPSSIPPSLGRLSILLWGLRLFDPANIGVPPLHLPM